MMKAQELKRIGRSALFGAIGFGIGGLIVMALVEVAGENVLLGLVGVAAMGSPGGAALGLALRRGRRKTIGLALFCGIGFSAGLFSVGLTGENLLIAAFPMSGALTGVALGLALGGRRKTIGLAIAGALGFGIGMMITIYIPFGFVPMGIIGGAFLGATLGYLEKEKAGNQLPLTATS